MRQPIVICTATGDVFEEVPPCEIYNLGVLLMSSKTGTLLTLRIPEETQVHLASWLASDSIIADLAPIKDLGIDTIALIRREPGPKDHIVFGMMTSTEQSRIQLITTHYTGRSPHYGVVTLQPGQAPVKLKVLGSVLVDGVPFEIARNHELGEGQYYVLYHNANEFYFYNTYGNVFDALPVEIVKQCGQLNGETNWEAEYVFIIQNDKNGILFQYKDNWAERGTWIYRPIPNHVGAYEIIQFKPNARNLN